MIKPLKSVEAVKATPRGALGRRPLAQWIAAALAMGAAMQAHAGNPPPLSQAWLAGQRGQVGAPAAGNVTTPVPTGLAAQTSGQLLQQRVVQQSIANLNNAAQAVAAQLSAQQSAQKAAQQLSSPVPDGLAAGGLQVAAGLASNPLLWQNANAPVQTAAAGKTTVEVKQTAAKAIMTWDSFNVGRNTTLYFNQSGGNQSSGANDWIALNRIQDPSGSPSQILGQIKAEGTVYLLNRNGILFGAGSQVNTHSLLASSLNLFSGDVASSNTSFMSGGISSQAAKDVGLLVDGAFTDGRKHDVVIEKGASITTGAQGFALIAAPNVSNAGSIIADDGQAVLAAGSKFANAAGSNAGAALKVANISPASDPQGLASNTGLVQSRRGEIHMLGYDITQSGVVVASTSISHPGSVELNARDAATFNSDGSNSYFRSGSLVLGAGSVTTVLPEKDGTTTSSGAAADAAFKGSNLSLSGSSVTFQSGSLLEAPGASLSIVAQVDNAKDARVNAGRVYVDDGAILDVSGLANVALPMSALLVNVARIGQNELANSPLLRNSFLYTQKNIAVDSSQSGTRADGLDWVGSPILNVAGYVENVPRDISQMLTKGGTISLAAPEVMVRSGAQLNLDGGFLAYQPGWVETPNLLGANGRIYNITDADPNMTYVGFAGQYTLDHSRWGITQTYNNPLLAGARRWDQGFVVGGDAGELKVQAGHALVLDGDITAQAFAGRNQVGQGKQPAGGTFDLSVLPSAADPKNTLYSPGILLQQSALVLDALVPTFGATTSWDTALASPATDTASDADLRYWLPVSASMIDHAGFSALNLDLTPSASGGQILEQAGTSLGVRPGGSIAMKANRVTVLGDISAPAGSIAMTTTAPVSATPSLEAPDGSPLRADITIGSGATLSTRGLWVNDAGRGADALIGGRYINGGSISLVTQAAVAPSGGTVDGTGSILLKPGSVLDVSGGGYVGPDNRLQLSHGVPDGHGGDISLSTYAGGYGTAVPPNALDSGSIELDGSLRGYGFSGGGTLTMQAPLIQIGGDASAMPLANGLYLAPGFFAGQGFDNYALTAITDAIIAPGAQVQVTRGNWLPNYQALLVAPTGSDLYASDAGHPQGVYATIGALDPYHRYVTRNTASGHGPGLSLTAGQYLDWSVIPLDPSKGAPTYAGVAGSVSLGEGAAILADAGAHVALAGTQATTILGAVSAPGGDIAISTQQLNRRAGLPALTPQIWLGASASLDASGTSLIDPWAGAVSSNGTAGVPVGQIVPRTGVVLAGGNVSLTGFGGYVLAEQGSRIDVSGASDRFDLPGANGNGLGTAVSYLATPVWSDAGSIAFSAAAGLYMDAQLQAQGGATQAQGGSLSITGLTHPSGQQNAPDATGVLLQQSGALLPSGLMPGTKVESGAPSGVLHFAVDRLGGSGISTMVIGPDPAGSPGAIYPSVVPLAFAGDVRLSLGRAFMANASAYRALPQGSGSATAPGAGYATGNASVRIDAPYVNLSGSAISTAAPMPMSGDGALQVNADFIDLGGQLNLQRWANANFTSSGDIRFVAPSTIAYNGNTERAGLLFSTGNLQFKAAQLYPATDYHFVIDANGSGLKDASGQPLSTTVTVLPNGNSTAPLSAGGALLISANHIEQQGTIRVPSGNLMLGVTDPTAQSTAFGIDPTLYPLAVTQSLHLAPGSLTSVSLDGQTVPFGSTIDGVQWRYKGNPVADSPDLTAAPSKQIALNGDALALDAGAGIDLSGGGHLQASEWVTGVGGTRDVLAQQSISYENNTAGVQVPQYADGRAIYAILPGYHAPLAPHDAALENGAGAGPAVGQSVYLSGAPGLAAGYYTLLPAKYATLPGAYRVVQDTSARDSVLGRSATQADGTLSVAGYFADALSGARDARNTTFLLQSGPVWQQYSQYRLTDADTFFAALAAKAGNVAPPSVADAGRLALAAGRTLDLGATLIANPATGGRGSLVDIGAQAIQIVGANEAARDGYLSLTADGLDALGAGSLLIGGSRQASSHGYQVSAVADSVVLSNDAAHPLRGPEILLVANGSGHPGAQGVLLEQGSVLQAAGQGSGQSSVALNFGAAASTDANGKPIAAVSGDGALLRVSQNGAANIVRNSVSGNGALSIGAGARVDGGSALTLDATGATTADPTAALSAQAIDANSNQITFLGDGVSAPSGAGGFVIGKDTLNLLRNAQSVSLRSRGNIDFLGNVNVDLAHDLNLSAGTFTSDGGAVSLEAGKLGLSNDFGALTQSFATGGGQLTIHANELDFGAGNTGLRGFGGFSATAGQGMKGQGAGHFDFGSLDVNLTTPWLLADNAADTQLSTTGALNITGSGGAVPTGVMGGALSLKGGTVNLATTVAAPAGNLDIEATHGDLTIASGSKLTVGGINKTFFDTTTYAPGGALSLSVDQGAVNLAPGSTLDFSGAGAGGDAGSLSIQAGTNVLLSGTLLGQAKDGYRGGYFILGSGGAVDLDRTVDIATAAGATGLFQVSSGTGDLNLSVGHTLKAQQVYLNASGGIASDASGGHVVIGGTIDAAGHSGSRIALYGNKGVDVEGSLIATSDIPAQRGGDVVIATSSTPDGNLNPSYGYQEIRPEDSGFIHLGANARIDVSGGSSDAFSGGSVSLRAPLLSDGDVHIAVDGGGASIKGARVVTVEPYAIWSSKDTQADPAKHFDGVIDPAGWYQLDASGNAGMVAGTWADASGKILAAPATADQLKQYLQNNFFIPDKVNGDHAGFYGYLGGDASKGPGTLMRYVQQPGYSFGSRYAGIANLQLRPGIELNNPSDGAQHGKISVLTNWNLGAGTTQSDGSIALAYRYLGMAPVLTVRAAGDLDIQASITDGFYQQNNGAALANPALPPPSDNGYAAALAAYTVSQQYLDANHLWNGTINLKAGSAAQGYTPGGGTVSIASDPYYQSLQAPLSDQSANYYLNYQAYIGEIGDGTKLAWANTFRLRQSTGFLAYSPTALVAPQPAAYGKYGDYVTAYQSWLTGNFAVNPVSKRNTTPSPLLLPLATDYTQYTTDYASYIAGHTAYYVYVSSKVGNATAGSQLFYAPFAPGANPNKSNPAYDQALTAYRSSQQYLDANSLWNGTINLKAGSAAQGYTPGGGTISIASDPYYKALQAPLQGQSDNYYVNYEAYIGEVGDGTKQAWANTFRLRQSTGFLAYSPTALVAPQPAAYGKYSDYVVAYQAWLTSNFAVNPVSKRNTTPSPLLLPLATDYTQYTTDYSSYIAGHAAYYVYVSSKVGNATAGSQLFYAPFAPLSNPAAPTGGGKPTTIYVPASVANNSPSNMPTLGSPASLASATLLGGSSASYRLVAGAQLGSVDPMATHTGGGNVQLDGHFATVSTLTAPDIYAKSPFNGKTLLLPTTVRTGSGSIDVATGGDIDWLDASAPAVIYTAGMPAAGTSTDAQVSVVRPNWISSADAALPYMLSTGQVNPEHGGDLSLMARGNINAIQQVIDATGNVTKSKPGTDISQYWWPWMQTANAADGSASSINFANFGQGVMSVGGNVAINAGGNISQLSVSLPTTWRANADGTSVTTFGGGNLDVHAGGDILSGAYFVGKGKGTMLADGAIAAGFSYTAPPTNIIYGGIATPVSTLLALQDAQWDVHAQRGADIGGVYNPSYLNGGSGASGSDPINAALPAEHFDSQSYGAASSLNVTATLGDVDLDSLSTPGLMFSYGSSSTVMNPGAILPATLNLQALSGSLDIRGAGALYPSATGNLTLLAADNVNFSQLVYTMGTRGNSQSNAFGLIDASPGLLPSALQPTGDAGGSNALGDYWAFGYLSGGTSALLHSQNPLHRNDTQPVKIYALQGDIVNGIDAPNGFQYRQLQLIPSKQAQIQAGRDIVNLSLVGQHLRDADVTRVAAGRDIYDTAISTTPGWGFGLKDPGAYGLAPALLLGGPGSFLVEAGRNIGPLTNETEVANNSSVFRTGNAANTGIDSVGNLFNPYLPHVSADISVLYGVGPGMATGDFMARYVDGSTAGVDSLMPELVAFMNRRMAGQVVDTGYAQDRLTVNLTPQQARQLFDQQPDYVQRQFVSESLFKILAAVGADYNDAASQYHGQYARGYAAIDTLFPASFGYTANGSGQGGLNGAARTVDTGDLDIRSTTIQTQQGGNITILGPGGQALLGSASAPPVITDSSGRVVAGPNSMGVLTLEQGSVNMFTDRSVLLAQSRIFTEQGGDLVMWSSNGDINAGQGAKTTAEIPPPTYLCTIDAWCRIDARGQVSGAGIATLQTVPGAPAGSVYLIAPRGTVDAGDAGIRVAGNLIVAAAQVANADNIQVQGEKIGVPIAQSVNVGALNAANAAASAVTKAAEDMARQQQDDARSKQPSIISVQVLGFGDNTSSIGDKDVRKRYDPNSPVQVFGGGALSTRARSLLTPEESKRLTE
ncbi:filamentous haemagglutinin family protein [Dyella koreensis]|uniref:Filamentous hemagglutinin family protein n=1 Tax=Dyella koreensis TaxID=311235 RepID=A0ABW8KCD6_9GAMM